MMTRTSLIWRKTLIYISKKLHEFWVNTVIFIPRHIVKKLLIDKDEEKILQLAIVKWHIMYKEKQ